MIATLRRMSKRVLLVILMAVALVGAGGATAIVLAGSDEPVSGSPECVTAQERADAVVHTGAFPVAAKLEPFGQYEAIHWQVRTPGACGQTPAPTGKQYQAFIKLKPADAKRLATQYDWLTADAFDYDGMWPGLAPLVPAGVKWNNSWQLDDVLLDPQKAVAYAFVTG